MVGRHKQGLGGQYQNANSYNPYARRDADIEGEDSLANFFYGGFSSNVTPIRNGVEKLSKAEQKAEKRRRQAERLNDKLAQLRRQERYEDFGSF